MQRAKSLNIEQISTWPNSLPSVSWRGWILAGNSSQTLDVSDSSLGQALRLAYPQLGLTSIAKIVSQIPEEAENICQSYHLRWSARLDQILALILTTPIQFQKWIEEKQFSPRDLFPLLAIRDLKPFFPILQHLCSTSLSRSLAAQALEWSVELYLMDVPVKKILADEKNWWRSLRRLRRPKEFEQAEKRDRFLRETPLPSHASGQWLEGSDQPALEIKMQAKSPEDLLQLLNKLKAVSEAWQKMEST
jgi:hypothetical protein